jgi:hypothetical protein
MPKYQIRNVGTLEGKGTLGWRDNGPVPVQYAFSGFHNPNNDTVESKGSLSGETKALGSAFGRSDVELTIADGRKFRASLVSGGHSGEATIYVSPQPDEFLTHLQSR